MKQHHRHSVDDLKRASDRSRAALVSTIGELRDKVSDTTAELRVRASPAHIKQEVRTLVRNERDQLGQSVKAHIRDNPLQAAAVAALVAWPALGLVRAIPVPLLLIGAGLWLNGSQQGRRASDTMQRKAREMVAEGASRAHELTDTVREQVSDLRQRTEDGLHQAGDAVATRARRLAEHGRADTAALADKVGSSHAGGIGDTVDRVQTAVSTAAQTVAATVDRATASAQEHVQSARGHIERLPPRMGNKLRDVVDHNPLLLAGIGLAAGAMIASVIPTTGTERRLAARARDEVKGQLRVAASEGLQRTADVVDDAVKAAGDEGLDSEGLARPIASLAGEVRAVASRAIDIALGEQPSDRGASPDGEAPTALPAPAAAVPFDANSPQRAPALALLPTSDGEGTESRMQPDREQPAHQASAPQTPPAGASSSSDRGHQP